MALQVWLPLNGNIKNLGLSNLKFSLSGSGITTDSSGKIGSCYKRASARSGGRIASNTTINLNGSISMFCWAKVTACVGDTANGLVSNHSHANNTGFGITVKLVSASDFRISCSTGNGSSRTYMTYYGTTNIKDKWCHLGLTYNKTSNTLKLWVNGSCEYTGTYTNSSRADYIWIFDWSTTYGDASYLPACSINDVRIYDHCLLEDEIHELSLGKVAHWTLDENSLSGQNLITSLISGGNCTVSGNNISVSGTNSDSYFLFNISEAMVENGLYKISCRGSGFQNGSYYNFPIAAQSNSGPGILKIQNGYCLLIFVANNTIANAGTRILMDDNGRVAGAGTISDIRLVKLNKSCDISGNHNDLTVNGNPTLSDDSVRYDKSTLFNGSNYLSCTSPTAEAKTLSLWAYIGSIPTSSSVLFADYKSKLSLGFYNSGTLLITRCGGTSATLGTISSLVKTNSWNHFCVVNGTTNLLYINGLATTMSGSNNWTHSTDTLMIGMRSAGTGFANKISDVRLYATALSADDVLKLYKLGN